MATATKRTLDTVELLEMILARTDTKTLLSAKTVCKQWNDVIEESKEVQRTLQFEAVYATGMEKASMTHLTETGQPIIINPLALKSITANGLADAGDTALSICLHPKASHQNMQVASPGIDMLQVELSYFRQGLLAKLFGAGFWGGRCWVELKLGVILCVKRHVTIGDIVGQLENSAARDPKVKIKARMISLRCAATGEWVHLP